MQLNSKVYDVLKPIALIWLPALGTLYAVVAGIWGLPASEQVVGTIVGVDTFLGAVLGISSASYTNSDAQHDGELTLEDHPDGGTQLHLTSLDAQAVLTKPSISLKINNTTTPEPKLPDIPLPSAPTPAPDTKAP